MPPSRVAPLLGLLVLTTCGRTVPLEPRPPVPVAVCALLVEPASLDFGTLTPGGLSTRTLTLRNDGDGPCAVHEVLVDGDSEPTFAITSTPAVQDLVLGPAASQKLTITFAPGPAAPPMERKGTLSVLTPAPQGAVGYERRTVALAGRLAYCHLAATPEPLDLGNVALNTSALGRVTLRNEGSVTCDVTGLHLAPGTSPLYSLPTQPSGFSVQPGATASVQVQFTARDSQPPHLRTGTLAFDANDAVATRREVGLSAYINTICTEAGQYIYTVDNDGRFSRFDPRTLTYVDIVPLQCPTTASPFSMNVDQSGIAWVIFGDARLYSVNVTTGACAATTYLPGQSGFTTYGMGSTWDSKTATDTLYVAGLNSPTGGSPLGKLWFPSLTVTPVGTIPLPSAELAGTGDGQLWAFSPASQNGGVAALARVDPTSGALIERYTLPTLTSQGGWAIKFFGGAFYIFVGSDVWKLDRGALDPTKSVPLTPPTRVLVSPGRDIVGAGVSTCAPVQ